MTVALTTTPLYRFFRAGDDEVAALRGVTLTAHAGDVVAVVGPSGSGKSTLLACLAGTEEPDGGIVTVTGQRMTHRPEVERAALRARSIGLMFQQHNLFAHLTVRANTALVQRLAGHRPDRHRVEELLDSVGLAHRAAAYPAELSGGESARAALAVALANDPAVLIADEPTGELDADTERRVLALLRARARDGVAVLIASHSDAVRRSADRVVALVDGELVR